MNKSDSLLTQQNNFIDEHIYTTTSDLSGKITHISQAYLDFTGYTKENIIGQNHKIFRNYDLDKKIIKQLWDVLVDDKTWEGELKNNKASGEEYMVHAVIRPLYDEHGVKVAYMSILEDISDKKRLQEIDIHDPLTLLFNRKHFETYFKRELTRSIWKKENFSLLLVSINHYSDYKNSNGKMLSDTVVIEIANNLKESLSNTLHQLFKISESEFATILPNCSDKYISSVSNSLLQNVEKLHIKNPQSNTSEDFTISIGASNIDMGKHDLYCNDIYNITDKNLSVAKQNGKNNAVTETTGSAIKELKNVDLITKLPNRAILVHDISLLEEKAMLILLHIKQINTLKNLYGYEFTTDIISQKANELKNVVRDEEVSLYSLNLQEFAILVTSKNLFEKYLLLLEHSILINDNFYIHDINKHISANFTAGVSYGMINLFNHADLVLQEAILSKTNYKIYQSNQTAVQVQEENLKRLRVYKNALYEGNIIPYFQPIIDNENGSIIKYEALARLQTEDNEIISPYYFLDSAKEDQSFEFFTRQMMQKVFNIYAKNSVNISLNLSYDNITSASMIEYIENRLQKYGGKGITFEIVESEDIVDYKVLDNFIKMIKSYECEISIDDFGSGYSNFTNILQLDIDYIKLDGSLIEKLNEDKNIENMIEGLILYSKNAKIKTIAEFVSTQELADRVKELGITYSQGYYYGEPKDPKEYGLN